MVHSYANAQTLSNTAYWTAAVRALEHQRPDRLFADPWAQALAGQVGAVWMAGRPPESVVPIILRTRFFDDFLLRIADQENVRQVVMLAAGLDTRAYRLAWPEDMRFFELDQENVLDYKVHVLGSAGAKPVGELHRIAIDLSGDWQPALLNGGFDPEQPAVWLLEGFLFYLSSAALENILNVVCEIAAPASWLGFDCINSLVLTSPLTRKWVEMQAQQGAPWIGSLDDPISFLAQRGWQATVSQAGEPEANFGRWKLPVLPVLMPNMPHNWYVTAQKG